MREDVRYCKCGKVAFPDRGAALSAAKTIAKRKLPRRRHPHRKVVLMRADNPRELHAYVCDHGSWHVGHKRKEKR